LLDLYQLASSLRRKMKGSLPTAGFRIKHVSRTGETVTRGTDIDVIDMRP